MKIRIKPYINIIPAKNPVILQYVHVIIYFIVLIAILYNLQNFLGYQSVSLILLLLISIMPVLGFSKGPIILSAFIAVIGWNFYFIPPHFTMHIEKSEDIIMLAMFFVIAIINGMLTSKLKKQEVFIKKREERTNVSNVLLKALAKAESLDDVSRTAVEHIRSNFGFDSAIIYAVEKKLNKTPHTGSTFQINDIEWFAANICFNEKKECGRCVSEIPDCEGLYFPLLGTRSTLGVIGIRIPKGIKLGKDEIAFLKNFISQIITAAEREILNELAKKALIISEAEKLYKTLFNSVSHEFRTPLTSIIVASSSLEEDNVVLRKELRAQLLSEIKMAAERLNKLVENLLDITRLESGHINIKTGWNDLDDLLNIVLNRLKEDINQRGVKIKIISEPMLFRFDFSLLEQALINIIHNCIIYTPLNAEIIIEIKKEAYCCIIIISDNGNGFPDEAVSQLFNKFYRIPGTTTGGTGLGLSIAKGFIEAHGGTITAANRPEGGAQFTIKLPLNDADGKEENTGN